jgi:hypothetical protein
MTKAALDSLPAGFGLETRNLIETYCMDPDRYTEMVQFGFARAGSGPRTASEIQAYCVRPDGQAIHSAAFVRDTDLGSLLHLFERTATMLSEGKQLEAARYSGVLAHFIEDSLSPPHSRYSEEVGSGAHAAIERSVPAFDLGKRPPQRAGWGLFDAAEAILDRLYAAADRNRTDLPAMMRAVRAGDQKFLDTCRLRAAKAAAELLADSLFTLFAIAAQ